MVAARQLLCRLALVCFYFLGTSSTKESEDSECSHSFQADARGTNLGDEVFWGAWAPEESGVVFDDLNILGDIELLASGFRWTEGPLWSKKTETLYFTDTIDAIIYRWHQDEGVTVVARDSGGPPPIHSKKAFFESGANGLYWANSEENALLVCQHGSRRVVRMDRSTMKSVDVIAEGTPGGKSFNSPNDVIMHNGSIYFTDPPYGLILKDENDERFALHTPSGLPPDQPYIDRLVTETAGITAVYEVDPSGHIKEFTRVLNRPNGLGILDNDALWVANSALNNGSWTSFNLTTTNIIDHIPYPTNYTMGPGAVDGFVFDHQNRFLWSSAPGGIIVIDVDQRRPVAAYRLGTAVSNLAFDHNYRNLYLTGHGHLWRLRLNEAALSMSPENKR